MLGVVVWSVECGVLLVVSCGGVLWCGVVWCGVVWCGVVWCGVRCSLVCSGVACLVRCVECQYTIIEFQFTNQYIPYTNYQTSTYVRTVVLTWTSNPLQFSVLQRVTYVLSVHLGPVLTRS